MNQIKTFLVEKKFYGRGLPTVSFSQHNFFLKQKLKYISSQTSIKSFQAPWAASCRTEGRSNSSEKET